MEKRYFIRYQAKAEDESNFNSVHYDIKEIAQRLEFEDANELVTAYESIEYHKGISADELIELITDGKDVDELTEKYPLDGLCGIEVDYGDIENLENEDKEKMIAYASEYLALYEGEYLCSVGDGDLFKPVKFLGSIKL